MSTIAISAPANKNAPLSYEDDFGLTRHDLSGVQVLAELQRGDIRHPLESLRCVCRLASGDLILAEINGGEAVQIGPSVTPMAAHDLASGVLFGASFFKNTPVALLTLSLAYVAAVAARQPDTATQMVLT